MPSSTSSARENAIVCGGVTASERTARLRVCAEQRNGRTATAFGIRSAAALWLSEGFRKRASGAGAALRRRAAGVRSLPGRKPPAGGGCVWMGATYGDLKIAGGNGRRDICRPSVMAGHSPSKDGRSSERPMSRPSTSSNRAAVSYYCRYCRRPVGQAFGPHAS